MLPKRFSECTYLKYSLIFLAVFLFISVLISTSVTPAEASDIDLPLMLDEAEQFVQFSQNEDGSWGSRLAIRDTALCAEALSWRGENVDALDAAMVWLSQNNAVNVDFISRKIWCLSIAGSTEPPTQVELDLLYASQHEDGGFSLAPDEGRNPLDTALALPALLTLGEMEKTEAAIEYLLASQLDDGGFSSFANGTADLPATALALKALSLRRLVGSTTDAGTSDELETACGEAAIALASYQNEDGGFGEEGSTPYETALALEALSWYTEETADTTATLSWMHDRQLEDGSISGDLAATALLLAAARPNPSIDGIELSDAEPPEGATLIMTFHLANRGISDTGLCSIILCSVEDPDTPVGMLEIENIPGRGTTDAELAIPTLGMQGPYDMLARLISGTMDFDFMDNSATVSFFVTPGYDFTVMGSDLSYSPEIPDCSSHTTLTAQVHNTGNRDAQDVAVSFYDGDPEAGGAELGTATIPFLDRGQATAASIEAILSSGEHAIFVLVDEDNLTPELSEDDNCASIAISVAQAATIPEPVSPENSAALASTTPTFTWLPSTGADMITYQLELDTNPDFTSPDLRTYADIPQQEELVSFTLPVSIPEGTWYWRVRALGGEKISEALEVRELTIDTTLPGINSLTCEPAWISPNDDGIKDEAVVSLTLSEDCLLDMVVLDNGGTPIYTLAQELEVPIGEHSTTWDGKDETGAVIEGEFTISVTAKDMAGNSTEAQASIGVDIAAPEIMGFNTSSHIFSPNGDGILDTIDIAIYTNEAGRVRIELHDINPHNPGEIVYMGDVLPETWMEAGENTLVWDGGLEGLGIIQSEGSFLFKVFLTDAAGNQAPLLTAPIGVDISPPAISFPLTRVTDDIEPRVRVTVEADAAAAWAVFAGEEAAMQEETPDHFTVEFDLPTSPGTYPVTIRATDEAGNTAIMGGANLVLPSQIFGSTITHTYYTDFYDAEVIENIDLVTVMGDITLDVNQGEILPSLPTALHRPSAFCVDGLFYIIGGTRNYIFDPDSSTYSVAAPMLEQRSYGDGAALGPDGKIYIFGGYYVTGHGTSMILSGSEAYDPATDTWTAISPLPEPLGFVRSALGPDGRIYIFGGFDSTYHRVDTVYAYDTSTDTYELVSNLPIPRCCHFVAEHEGTFYIGGGHDDVGDLVDMWRFDPLSLSWTRLADLPTTNSVATSAVFGPPDSLYVFFSKAKIFGITHAMRYSMARDEWELLPDTLQGTFCRGTTLGPDGRIYLFGGFDESIYGSEISRDYAEIYDPAYFTEATLISSPIDLGYICSFGELAVTAEVPTGTSAQFAIRTSEDGAAWSDWSAELPAPGGAFTAPPGRFLQYRLRLSTQDLCRTPRIFDISVGYNLGPRPPRATSPCGGVLTETCPEFKWIWFSDLEGETINSTLEIDRSPSFDTPELKHLEGINSGTNQNVVFQLPASYFLADGLWYWRVCSADGKVAGEWSYPLPFRVDTGTPVVVSHTDAPNPFSPDGDGVDDAWTLGAETSEEVATNLTITTQDGSEVLNDLSPTLFPYTWTKVCEEVTSGNLKLIAGPSGHLYFIGDRLMSIDRISGEATELAAPNLYNMYGCEAVVDAAGNIYAIWKSTGFAEYFDAASGTWSDIATFPSSNFYPMDVGPDGMLYVFGSWNNNNGLYRYDPATNAWSVIGSTPIAGYMEFRYYEATTAQNGLIYVCGPRGIWSYDPATNTFSAIQVPQEVKINRGLVGRDGMAFIYSESDPLYRKHFLLDPATGEITPIESLLSGYMYVEAGEPGCFFYRLGYDAFGFRAGPEDKQTSFTWDGKDSSGALVPDGTYNWTLEMEDVVGHTSVLEGDIVVNTGFDLGIVSAAPNPFYPRDCLPSEATNVTYNLGKDASVSVSIYPEGSEAPVRTFAEEQQTTGEHTLTWDGKNNSGDYVDDGIYVLRVEAETAYGNHASAEVALEAISTPLTISDVSVAPTAFSPNGDGNSDECALSFVLSEDVSLTLEVRASDGTVVAIPVEGELHAGGPVTLTWDGTGSDGAFVPDSTYTLALAASTAKGKEAQASASVSTETQAPVPTAFLPAAEPNHPGTPASFTVLLTEDAEISALEVGGQVIPLVEGDSNAWSCELPNIAGTQQAVFSASDALGNTYIAPLSLALPGYTGELSLLASEKEDFDAGGIDLLDSTSHPGWLINSATEGDDIPERVWTSPAYDLGASYSLISAGWSGVGAEAPAVTISCSPDGSVWYDLPEMAAPGAVENTPRARYVRAIVRFPAGNVTSVGDVSLTYAVPTVVPPDLTVASMAFDPPSPEEGDKVAVQVNVTNLGSFCLGMRVRLTADGQQIEGDKTILNLFPGAEAQVIFHYTATAAGDVAFSATVDPAGKITEQNEDNNILDSVLTIATPNLEVQVATDAPSYLAEEEVGITASVGNDSGRARNLALKLSVTDTSGTEVADLGQFDLGEVEPGESASTSASWNTGLTYAGDYQVKAALEEAGTTRTSSYAPFEVASTLEASLSLTSDRISYPAGSTAMLRSRVTNITPNRMLEDATVLVEVFSPSGEVIYTSQAPVDLLPSELRDFTFACAIGSSGPGEYTATSHVLSGEEELASAQATFSVSSTASTGAGLAGNISVPSPCEQGQVAEAVLSVTNSGNADLPTLPLTLVVVDPDTGGLCMTLEGSCDLSVGETENLTQAIDTALLPQISEEKHFLAILLAGLTDGQKNLAFSPILLQPAQVDHYVLAGPAEAVAEEAFSLSLEAESQYGYRPLVSGEVTLTDSTGTIAPSTIALEEGAWMGDVVIYEPAEACTINATDAEGKTGTCTLKVLPRVDIDVGMGVAEEAVPSVLVWCDGDANESLVGGVLDEAGVRYTIVRGDHTPDCGHPHKAGMEAFAAEMRSGTYNLFVILSADHPLEDHLADELVELTNSGAGLIVTDAKDIHHFKTHPVAGGIIDIFGIKEMGSLQDATYEVALHESPFSPQDTLDFTGKMKKLGVYDCEVLGEVTIVKGSKTEVWPAITSKEYGEGATLLFAFDLAQVAQEDMVKAEGILTQALTLLPQAGFTPDSGALLPLSVHLQNQGIATDVRVEVPIPEGMEFLWAKEGILDGDRIAFEFHLAEGEEKKLSLLISPTTTGVFDLTAQVFYPDDGIWILHREASMTVTVEKDASLLQQELTASVSALPVAGNDEGHRDEALARIGAIDLSSQDPAVLENNVFELVKAAEDLQKIDSADITGARLLLDRLIVQAQMLWYGTLGGDGS